MIKEFLKINKNYNQPKYININELIKKNKFDLNRTKNYFGKITVSENATNANLPSGLKSILLIKSNLDFICLS